jgi:chemotaxis methyl-accepting protein methylase
MLNFGICRLEQLDCASPALLAETRRYFRRFCNIELYEALARRGDPGDEALQAAVLDLFPIANGAFKRTSRQRFGGFDQQVVDCLSDMFHDAEQLTVHDMAVSDGRTACDFYRTLATRFGPTLDFVASDLCTRITALSRDGQRLTVIIDEDGVPLQLVWPPFVLPIAMTESWLYPVNRLIRQLLQSEANALRSAANNADGSLQRREILLLCTEARNYLAANDNFHIERHNIFDATPRRYRVVRAMNVFNESYFSPAQLAQGLARVHESLADEGVFVLGSNSEAGSTVNGGVYRKQANGFAEVVRCGNGPAIAPLLAAIEKP